MENKNSTKHPSAYKIISIVVIVILAILFTFPLYWIITGSFKTNAAINSTTPIWWPKEWTLANYQKLFSRQTAPLFQFNIPFSSLITGSRDLKLTLTGPTVPAAVRWLHELRPPVPAGWHPSVFFLHPPKTLLPCFYPPSFTINSL